MQNTGYKTKHKQKGGIPKCKIKAIKRNTIGRDDTLFPTTV